MSVTQQVALDLPEDLALPLATGAPWWYWLGGRPCVDFVNTRRERWWRDVETLVTPDDLAAWLATAGVAEGALPVPRGVVDEARALREAIDAGVRAAVGGGAVPAEAVRTIDDWLVFARERPQLVLGADGAPVLTERAPADSPRRMLGTIALDAATMLGTPAERERIRVCASETCSARFYDRSPAGRRVWCSMRACGNAAKARRHRERARA